MATQRQKRMDVTENYEDGTVTFVPYEDGEPLRDRGILTSVDDLPDNVQRNLAVEGLKYVIKGASSNKSGGDAADAMQAKYNSLLAGKWGTSKGPKVSVLAQAIARLKDRNPQYVQSQLDDMSKADQDHLRKHAKVAAEMQKIRAERAEQKAESAEESLDDLGL